MSSNDKNEATIVGGPIQIRGYDHLRLEVDHTVVMPNGSTMQLPTGTLLIMNEPGGFVDQLGGVAKKDESLKDGRDGSS